MKQSERIIQALSNLKIDTLNPMQEAAIDAWKEGKDLILLSPTGSGKTLAYLLPLLETLKPTAHGATAEIILMLLFPVIILSGRRQLHRVLKIW